MTNENATKKQFVAPTLVAYGKFEELTQGSATGTKLDAPFNAGDDISDLTFS